MNQINAQSVDGGQQHRHGHRLRVQTGAANDALERQAFDVEVVLGREFLRCGEVETGLRLARVSDGGGADLEIALGRCELLGDRLFPGLYRSERVGGCQHIEIGLGNPNDQVLLDRQQLRSRQLDAALGL